MKVMRLLVLSEAFPSPPTDGLRLPVFHLLRLLAPHHRIRLLSFFAADAPPSEAEVEYLRGMGVEVTLVPTRRLSTSRRLASLFSGSPDSLRPFGTGVAFNVVTQLAADIDLVHAMGFNMGQFRGAMNGVPGVFTPYDAVSLLLERYLQQPDLPLRYRVHYWLEHDRIRRYEDTVLPKWDAVSFVSPVDAEAIRRRLPGLTPHVIPNGVDVGTLTPPEDLPPTDKPEVLFTGAMFAYKNVDAVLFFHREVLPRIRARRPEVRFVVAGVNPAPQVRALARQDPQTLVTGQVQDLRPYLWRAAVYVCPLRVGVGIKNRVLEAMAAGCAIVTTPVGIEGIEAVPNRDLLVASGPEDMAEKVLRLLEDRALARRLGRSAREQVLRHYTWELVVNRIEDLYAEVLGRHSRS